LTGGQHSSLLLFVKYDVMLCLPCQVLEQHRRYSARVLGRQETHEKVIADRDGNNHLEFFMNGSWRHSREKCRANVNPQCGR
jgi:hypothetical protein